MPNPAMPLTKRYKCIRRGCTSSFSRRADLNRHDQTHTQSRAHRCEWAGCSKAFNQKGQLKTHKNTHTGAKPHKCEICSKSFGDPASRTRHRKEAHGGVTYQCHACGSRIKRLSLLKNHLREKHGIESSKLVHTRGQPEQTGGTVLVTDAVLDARYHKSESEDSSEHRLVSIFHPNTSYSRPGASGLGPYGAPYQISQGSSPYHELGMTPSGSLPSSSSSSSSLSHNPYGFRNVPPAESYAGSTASSDVPPHVLRPFSDYEDGLAPVQRRLRHYNQPSTLERRLHARSLGTWHSKTPSLSSDTLPIDPVLLSLGHV